MGHETATDKNYSDKTNLEIIRTTFSAENFEQAIIIETMQPLRKACVLFEILFSA